MRFVSFVAAVVVVFACTAAAAEGKTYGKGVSDVQEVKVSELVAHPEQYVGKTVHVEGIVVDVCAKRGCWMDIANEDQSAKIRIKVEDGAMVFPVEAKGSRAAAEGVFTKIEMSPEEAKAYAKHAAEERGQVADANAAAQAVVAPKAQTVAYQIQGTGAVIN